jgi:predicted Zn-dependent protease with MMP-like domain
MVYNRGYMDRQRFEELAVRAVGKLPQEFQEKLENVDVVIEDMPSARQLRRLRVRQSEQLLGLYEGVPHTMRGQGYTLVLPDKITLFQESIESRCHNDSELEAEIGAVIRHEIAHHFGIGDAELRRIESRKTRKKQR